MSSIATVKSRSTIKSRSAVKSTCMSAIKNKSVVKSRSVGSEKVSRSVVKSISVCFLFKVGRQKRVKSKSILTYFESK